MPRRAPSEVAEPRKEPVDPDIEAMLGELNGRPQRKLTLAEAREAYAQQYLSMSAEPAGQVVEERIEVPGAHPETRLTLYCAEKLAAPAPLILYLHGGGWVLGDAAAYSRQSARIAEQCGAIVAFLDYRRSPEHRFPAALDDTMLALPWLAANAPALGADPSRLALMGDSAGGNLAIAAMRLTRAEVPLRCASLLYPVTDLRPYLGFAPQSLSDAEFASGYYLELAEMGYFGRSYLGDRQNLADDARVSPLSATDLAGLPPVSLYAAGHDVLRDQGEAFAKALTAAGNAVRYRRFDRLIHNFMQMAGISKAADAAFAEICRDMREALSHD
jgi:acetyl esterase